MKDLYEIFGECLDEIESMGIEVGTIKGCSINTRAKSRWGQCQKKWAIMVVNMKLKFLVVY